MESESQSQSTLGLVEKVGSGGIDVMSPPDSENNSDQGGGHEEGMNEGQREGTGGHLERSPGSGDRSDDPGESTGFRKREWNRRKSDPSLVKKIPKMEPESEQDEDDDEEFENDSEIEDKQDDKPCFRRKCSEGMAHFTWKDYRGHLSSAFESLLDQVAFCDVTLICDGDGEGQGQPQDEGSDRDLGVVALKAHKIVLSASSEYFATILNEHPCKHPTIVLKGYSAWEVRALLEFMYRGQVEVGMDQAKELVNSGKSLEIRGLGESLPGKEPLSQNKHNTNSGIYHRNNNNICNNNNKNSQNPSHCLASSPFEPGALNLSRQIGNKRPRTDDEPLKNHESLLNSGHDLSDDLSSTTPTKINPLNNNGCIMPRRKQARPRRRSGDYDLIIGEDLRKFGGSKSRSCSNSPQGREVDLDVDLDDPEDLDLSLDQEEEDFGEDPEILEHGRNNFPMNNFPMNMNIANLQQLLSGRNAHDRDEGQGQGQDQGQPRRRPGRPRRIYPVTEPPPQNKKDKNSGLGEDGPRRRSSRLHYGEREGGDSMTPDLDQGHEVMGMGMNHHDHDREHIFDYRTTHSSVHGPEKGGESRGKDRDGGGGSQMSNSGEDHLQQQHLAFLRNYNWAMAQRGKLAKFPEPSDLSEHLDRNFHPQTPPPPLGRGAKSTRSPKHPLHRSSGGQGLDPLSAFPFLPGLLPSLPLPHPHPPSPNHTQNNNKTPPTPTSPHLHLPPHPHPHPPSFLSSSPSMSITPLGTGGEERASISTPDSPYSPLTLPGLGMDAEGQGQRESGGGSRGKYKERERRSPGEQMGHGGHGGHPTWPGLGLGPPPIFGRHRAQHSAPRGGPPRAWSNADLTEALHNVWNKKMTTSQASRIFGIPYNSLLMYVRGKYGKSLKLDVLKKGLDQAMENSQNIAAAAAAAANNPAQPPNNGTSSSRSSSRNGRHNNAPSSPTERSIRSTSRTRSPSGANNNGSPPNVNQNSAAVSALLQSLHNNNTLIHKKGTEHNNNNNHHNHHKAKHSQNGGSEMSEQGQGHGGHGQGPPGFNPFFFGDFGGNPFPFASALQHILPPHLAGLQPHLTNGPHPLSQGQHQHQGQLGSRDRLSPGQGQQTMDMD